MSRELDLLAKEFSKTPVTVMRSEVNLYGSTIESVTRQYLTKVGNALKKEKQHIVTIVCIFEAP